VGVQPFSQIETGNASPMFWILFVIDSVVVNATS